MSSTSSGRTPSDAPLAAATAALSENAAHEAGAESVAALQSGGPTVRLKKGYITALVIAYCALYLAWIAPMSYSIAIRIGQIDPEGRNGALALATGIPGALVLVTGPLLGVLSDRTRFRLGRRRTWLLVGTVVGLIGSTAVGLFSSVPLVILAWSIAYIGYTGAAAMFVTHLSDQLPEEQRGRVSALTGAVTQVAPILGIVVAGAFISMPVFMFLVPASIAFVVNLVFLIVMKDSPATGTMPAIDLKTLFSGFYFNPRRHKNFGWVWVSRACVFLALSFMSVYSIYLLGERLHLSGGEIAGLVATAGLGGVVAAIVGAIAGGWLSDKLQTRKPFIVVAVILLAIGLIITATITNVPQYFLGSVIGTLGIGVFGSVDQAIMLDVLPQEEGQNGRYLATFNLANQAPQAVGPFLAAVVVGMAAGNYTWVYLVAAFFALLGGALILPVRVARRSRQAATIDGAPA